MPVNVALSPCIAYYISIVSKWRVCRREGANLTHRNREAGSLARFFSSAVIKELATKGRSPLAASLLRETGFLHEFAPSTSLRDFFDKVYSILFHNYRNEYIYKNAIAQKLLMGVHSLNTTFMLTEFRTGICKADVVLLNGTSAVYEIKSAYDGMERLTRQIAAYRQLFDKINVITADSQLEKVKEVVGTDIGLMILTDRNTIRTVQKPLSLKGTVRPPVIFDSLRKNEYEQIIKRRFGAVPNVPNTRIYQVCRDLFCTLSPIVAHDEIVTVLKTRGNSRRLREFVSLMPNSLKSASLSCKLAAGQQAQLLKLLDAKIGTCFAA